MAGDLQRKALAIYEAALEFSDPDRGPFVSREVAGDVELEKAVRELLDSADEADEAGFLATPVAANVKQLGLEPTEASVKEIPSRLPMQIDRYLLTEQIGEGGFGAVYLAEQTEPVKRQVAVKLIRSGLASKQFIKRFAAERQMLALLNHPNIAQVFDAGTSPDNELYLVMEYIQGASITAYCDNHELGVPERLDLFIRVCAAIQHAHQKGVIHRDIKPANVLIAENADGATPKVIDFGIAKALDLKVNEQTIAGAAGTGLIGSPSYMSPEQIEQAELDIDTRSDVYGLGVLLYELLTGSTPFGNEDDSVLTLLKKILEQEPARPSTMHLPGNVIPGDLDWIVLKALDKDRERRYESAAAFSADISRYLRNEPVLARPPTLTYRAVKFVRRHTIGAIATAIILLTLIGGIIGTSMGFLSARSEAAKARKAEATALAQTAAAEQTVSLLLDFLSSADPREKGRELKVVELLEAFKPELNGLDDQPAVRSAMLYTYGKTFAGLGLFSDAAQFAEEALTLRQTVYGDEHPATIEAAILWTDVLRENGRFDKAEQWGEEALDLAKTTVGNQAPLTFLAATALANVYKDLGQFEEAEALHREALSGRRTLLGENHPDTLQSMIKLSGALMFQNKLDEAETLNRIVFEKRKSILGENHPDTLVAANELAFVLAEGGKLEEGLALHQANLVKRREVLGPEHPKALTSMANVAWVLGELGRFEEAEAITREAWEIEVRVLGPDHPATLVTQGNLAAAIRRAGRLDEAEELHRTVWQKRKQILGADHPATLTGLNDLALVVARQSRYEEAESLFRDLVARRGAVIGEEHAGTLTTKSNLGWVLTRLQDYPAATAAFRETQSVQERVMGLQHPHTLSTMNRLANVLVLSGQLEEAESVSRDLLARREIVHGPNHRNIFRSMTQLGRILEKQGLVDDARQLYQESLEGQVTVLGADHGDTKQTRQYLDNLIQ